MNPNERKIIGMSAGGENKFCGRKASQFRVKDCICNPSLITGIGVYALQNWCTVYLNPYR